jgi:hypothetical protein
MYIHEKAVCAENGDKNISPILFLMRDATTVTAWVFKKNAKTVAKTIFCQNNYITYSVEKTAKNFGEFCNNFPKAAQSKQWHNFCENSANLVTLDATRKKCGKEKRLAKISAVTFRSVH